MTKKINWDLEFDILEMNHEIQETKEKIVRHEELFNKYAEVVKSIDPILYGWLESGYSQHQFYNEMDVDNRSDWLSDVSYRREVRKQAAIKAAETRKANKLKS
jgi:hypothetical protein